MFCLTVLLKGLLGSIFLIFSRPWQIQEILRTKQKFVQPVVSGWSLKEAEDWVFRSLGVFLTMFYNNVFLEFSTCFLLVQQPQLLVITRLEGALL